MFDFLAVLLGPRAQGHHGLAKGAAEFGQSIIDARRDYRREMPLDETITFQAAQRQRQHSL